MSKQGFLAGTVFGASAMLLYGLVRLRRRPNARVVAVKHTKPKGRVLGFRTIDKAPAKK